jgi:titin
MSYVCNGETRIPYFSNPDVFYNGQPTGILGYNNTARSMNATASTVASFRASTTIATVPNAPTGLTATAASTSAIALTWGDNAGNETGYYVQRSPDGSSWALIATLASNATSFNDSWLNADTTYYYQVYAYNSVGNSGFSNTASAKTQAAVVTAPPPADTVAPSVTITNPQNNAKVSGTSQTINVSASDNVAVTSLQLSIDGGVVAVGNTGSLSYNWNTKKVKAGSHTIAVVSADAAGNTANTAITVTK